MQDVIGAVGVAGAQPKVGHHPRFGDEGQQGVMTGPAAPVGVVAADGTVLRTVAGDHRGIHIQRDAFQGIDLPEKPAVDLGLYPLVRDHVETAKQSQDSFMPGSPGPVEQTS